MKILFAGPSLAENIGDIQSNHPHLVVAGPAVWGDIAQAVFDGATAIGIVDGCFEQTRAVWHKEILYALSKGVSVAGAASMGALRAAECASFGMIGIGQIYDWYTSRKLTDDSDVALVHATEEFGYVQLSEPRVNIFATLKVMHARGLINTKERRAAEAITKRTHYAKLSIPDVIAALPLVNGDRRDRLIELSKHHRVNLKQQDALQLVEWLCGAAQELTAPTQWQFSESAQWQTLTSELRESV